MTVMTGGGLHVSSITKRYGATVALDGVELVVQPGEIHALVGENGAGKSTLVGVLAGGIRADRDEMSLDGAVYAPTSPHDARQRGVALIHQELSLCPHLTVQENVLLGAEQSRHGWIDRARSRQRALALLQELPHPELAPHRRVRDLSLPAQQIVEICRALAADTRVLLMDEPTSSLQGSDVERLFALIRRLAARGVAIIYISHFLEEVRQIANRFTVLRDGRAVGSGAITSSSNNELITMMVGRQPSGLFPTRVRAEQSQVALSVRDLRMPPRLNHASFDLHRGEILGIAGLLGSGRTELVRALFGLETPKAGSVWLAEQRKPVASNNAALLNSAHATTAERVRAGVGYVSEDRKGEGLALPMSVEDNLCATRPELSIASLGVLDMATQRERAAHWIRELRIRARSSLQPVRSLSGGNQQKVAVGRLLHQQANVLLLDEPTRGIDIGSKADVYETIVRQADAGCAVLFVSSYLPELFGLCDRIAVMCRGRLSEARHVSDWTPEQVLATAMGSATAAYM